MLCTSVASEFASRVCRGPSHVAKRDIGEDFVDALRMTLPSKALGSGLGEWDGLLLPIAYCLLPIS